MNNERSDTPTIQELTYFRGILSGHNKIGSFAKIGDQQFDIERVNYNRPIRIYLSGLYTIGIADCMDIIELFPDVNCIVTSSVWNGYTQEAKEFAMSKEIGLFVVKEFMGAMSRDDFWNYIKTDSKGKPIDFSRG